MIKLSSVYKKAEGKWVSRSIMDEVVIMPLCRSQDDMQYIYSISNQIGSKIWQLLDGEHCVGEIQEILKSVYDGQAEVIEREVLEFIGDVFEAKLIEEDKTKTRKTKDSQYQIPQKKEAYKSPEIAKIKMQPEQAVLSCCTRDMDIKQSSTGNYNSCSISGGYTCYDNPNCPTSSNATYAYGGGGAST